MEEEQRPPSTAASSTGSTTASSTKSWPLPVNIARRHRAPTNPFDTDPFEMGSLSTSTSRAELYSPNSTPPPTASSNRSTQSSLRSTAKQQAPTAPATVRLNGADHQTFLFANLDQLSMAVLRQRAMRLRDVLEKPAKERKVAMPFGEHGAPLPADRRILQAFILDAQLVLVRLAGHDAKKEWTVMSAFGAPADLTTVTSASLLEKNQWSERDQTQVLTPLGMGWQEAVAEGRISGAPLASPRMAPYHNNAAAAAGGARSGSSCQQASSSSLRGSASAASLASSTGYSSRPHTAPAPPANHEGGGAPSPERAGGGSSPSGRGASARQQQADALPDVSLPVMR